MDTQELLHLGQSCSVINKHFIGVFPIDDLPVLPSFRPVSFIINLDTSIEPGSHWVCVYYPSYEHAEYVDSYGIQPMSDIENELLPIYEYNNTMYQSLYTTVCGQYCLFYLFHRSKMRNMNAVLSLLDESNTLNSDCIVKEFVNNHYNVSYPLIDFNSFYT